MDRRFPSLHLLKIFEAAGRHESFKLAAEELHLTPSAVSHQIKALEEQIGFQLFQRLNRQIKLTAGGRAYWDVISDTFKRLHRGTHNVLQRFAHQRLKISLMSSIASQLLIPNLNELKQLLPNVDLIIDSSSQLVDFATSDVDVGIRFGRGHWDSLAIEKISDTHFSPMCHPDLIEQYSLTDLSSLDQVPLIGYSFMTDAWLKFSHATGQDQLNPDASLIFDNYDLAIQAAEQGLGVALALTELEFSKVTKHSLIMPFDIILPMPDAIYRVCRIGDENRPEVIAFTQWLTEKLNQTQAPHPL